MRWEESGKDPNWTGCKTQSERRRSESRHAGKWKKYPAVLGFDIAGLVLEVGAGVPVKATDGHQGPIFEPRVTRVAAYSAATFESCQFDYGAFQERCIVPWQHAAPITDPSISWDHVATLPVSVQVPLCAWDAMGLDVSQSDAKDSDSDTTLAPKEALLIWGASSSVGTMGVQMGRLQKTTRSPIAAVYATAVVANHEYVKSLGADSLFDYKSATVGDDIVLAAKEDGLVIRHCFLANGDIRMCQAVLAAFAELSDRATGEAKIASAPVVPPDTKEVLGLQTIFLVPSTDKSERLHQFAGWMVSLSKHLSIGAIRPSLDPHVVGTGLECINAGLDRLAQGVSCSKLVVQVGE